MTQLPGRRAVLSLATATLVAASGLALAQQGQGKGRAKSGSAKASAKAERAAGVIVKVEPVTKGATPGSTITDEAKKGRQVSRTVRLTINTAAVWRDWARDQPPEDASSTPKKDAAEGANSIATKGQPVSPDTTVLVDVGPETRIETRFRSPDDETSKGATTPDGATQDDDPAADSSRSKARPGTSKVGGSGPSFRAQDLKPGLFIEADYRHMAAQTPASVVAVIRPTGGPIPTTKDAAPTSKKARRKNR